MVELEGGGFPGFLNFLEEICFRAQKTTWASFHLELYFY